MRLEFGRELKEFFRQIFELNADGMSVRHQVYIHLFMDTSYLCSGGSAAQCLDN